MFIIQCRVQFLEITESQTVVIDLSSYRVDRRWVPESLELRVPSFIDGWTLSPEKLDDAVVGFICVQRYESRLFWQQGSHVTNSSKWKFFEFGDNCSGADGERLGFHVSNLGDSSSCLKLILWWGNVEGWLLAESVGSFKDSEKVFNFSCCNGRRHNLYDWALEFLEWLQLEGSVLKFPNVWLE